MTLGPLRSHLLLSQRYDIIAMERSKMLHLLFLHFPRRFVAFEHCGIRFVTLFVYYHPYLDLWMNLNFYLQIRSAVEGIMCDDMYPHT